MKKFFYQPTTLALSMDANTAEQRVAAPIAMMDLTFIVLILFVFPRKPPRIRGEEPSASPSESPNSEEHFLYAFFDGTYTIKNLGSLSMGIFVLAARGTAAKPQARCTNYPKATRAFEPKVASN